MAQGKAEDAGGLAPAKDDNAALHHFDALPIFRCVDYIYQIFKGEGPGRDYILRLMRPSSAGRLF